eukprot:GHVT01065301.1.p2 GENE.GHVT01065301.1~~GHVT01065301.1.p2  ORF type:complete len:128 (+),score=12.25 GHVT01065301.1:49-384(+)
MEKAMDPFDGEPELETHPDIETVTTTLIAIMTRSGTQTDKEEIGEPEDREKQASPQIPCGQTTQLVLDVPTDSEEEPEAPEAALPDLQSDDEESIEETANEMSAGDRMVAD